MIPKECKRLAEVDFPIAVVSKHAAREKSIRHGHPSTLHLWWARRPLAACRAMLLGLLLPDPCDVHCPAEFKQKARELLPKVQGKVGFKDEDLRKSLLKFIGDFANWDLSSDRTYLDVSRGLVKAAHPEETPLVVDPFAGGGSIPLEALRLGCEAFASDLNPVACLILKVMLEDIPRHGSKLAEELRRVGAEIKKQAEKELAGLYPKDPDGSTPIAYLWARTVRCESPDCGAEIPLVRSFWLCKKANRKRALRIQVKRQKEKGKSPEVDFEIFEPENDREVPNGTVTRAKASCPVCNMVLGPERVRAQLAAQRGGADVVFDDKGEHTGGSRLLAVVLLKPAESGRQYRLPDERDYEAVRKAQSSIAEILAEWERAGKHGLCPVPDESLPPIGTLGFRVQRYGMLQWGDLFTARQKAALLTLAQTAAEASNFGLIGSLTIGKLVDLANAVCRWEPVAECPRNVFAAGRVKPAWDFAEGVITSDSSGSWTVCVDNLTAGVLSIGPVHNGATVQIAKAQNHPLPDNSAPIWFTDPPYYDAYPYADLSDVFLAWYKRNDFMRALMEDPFEPSNPLSPKDPEAVQDESRMVGTKRKDAKFFEEVMADAFAEGSRILSDSGIGCVVFAHKTTEGWEALISGMIRGGLTVVASWPIATEQAHRLRAQDSAALGTSVHLICRPRSDDAHVGDLG